MDERTNKRKEREVKFLLERRKTDTETQTKNTSTQILREKREMWKKFKENLAPLKGARRSPWGAGHLWVWAGLLWGWEGLTEGRVAPRIWPERSYSGRVPSAGRPLPVWVPRSLSPGIPRGWRSGSLSAGERPGTVWPRHCSFCALPSTCHPARRRRDKQIRKK